MTQALNPKELHLLESKAKSEIINGGHRYLFSDAEFNAFWDDFWKNFNGSRAAELILNPPAKLSRVNLTGGIILGLYLTQHQGDLPKPLKTTAP
jgi:hypothetical protein